MLVDNTSKLDNDNEIICIVQWYINDVQKAEK